MRQAGIPFSLPYLHCRRIEGRAAGKKDWVPSDGQPDWFSINNWTHNSYLSSDILLHKALFSKKRRRGKTSFRANFGRSGQKVNQELGFESQPSFSKAANELLSRNPQLKEKSVNFGQLGSWTDTFLSRRLLLLVSGKTRKTFPLHTKVIFLAIRKLKATQSWQKI